MTLCVLLLVFLVSLWPSPLPAATRYVAKTGSSDTGNSCLTQAAPCATIGHCVSQMSSGDTCQIGNGIYVESNINPPSGSAGAPTTIKALTPRQAIIQPDDCDSAGWLATQGRSYVTFDGLKIDGNKLTDTGACIPFNNSVPGWTPAEKARKTPFGVVTQNVDAANTNHHLSFVNGEIANTRQSGMLIAGSAWLISNVWIHELGNHDQPCGFFTDCFPGPHHHGIYGSIHDSEISYNLFTDVAAYNAQVFASSDAPVHHVLVNGNEMRGSGLGFTLAGAGSHTYTNNLQVDDGTFSGVFPNALLVQSNNNQIHNNTLINRRIYGDYGKSGNVVRNNLLCGSNSPAVDFGGTAVTKSNNQEGSCPGGTFVNAGAGDYHLALGSVAINQGFALAALVPLDKDKNTRPIGGAWDQGAYEFGAAPPPPTQDLLAWWQFDEGTGSTAADSTGHGHTGTLAGSTLPLWTPGKVGPFALTFSGTNYVESVGSFTEQTYSWALWVKGQAAPDASCCQIVFANGIAADNTWSFGWSFDTARFRQAASHRDGSGAYITAQIPDTLNAGVWYHVAGTFDGADLKVYLNGILKATSPATSVLSPAGNFRIGGEKFGLYGFQGSIDDVRIYNYALTQPEIAALVGTPPPVVTRPPRHVVVVQ